MDTKILEEIGFTKKEIKVYFALLELGESSIGSIAKKAGVTLAKTYPILDKLAAKGLTSQIIKRGTRYFQAFNPERIISYLEDKRNDIEEQKSELNKILPQIISKQTSVAKHSAAIYESFDGMKTIYNDILNHLAKSKEDFIGFTLGGEYESDEANLFFKNYDAKRKSLGIKTKLIGEESQREFLKYEYGNNKHVEIRYVKQSVPNGLIIYGNKVAHLVWGKTPVAFVMESYELAKSNRNFFNDLWKKTKK